MSVRCLSCLKTVEGPVCPHCGYPETVTTLSHQLPVGTVLRERYQIGRVLGQGGFGITYLAWDALLQKSVAIKEFFPGGTVQRNCAVTTQVECIYTSAAEAYNRSTERFLREAQALVQFRDIPQVVDIQDFLRENNTAYIVMEFVKGVDLAKYIQAKGGRLTPEETFRILKPVMEALAKVHKGGIVHRDISPDNIVLDPLGGAKLLDFGAVRAVENPDAEKALDKSTEAILKHGFAPIEQYNTRGSLGPWTDVYAMCATVWYCLTGRIPEEASIRITEGTDPDWASIPGLSAGQQEALAKGIACRPKDRYPDMDSLLAGLFPAAQPEFPKTVAVSTKSSPAAPAKPEQPEVPASPEEKKTRGKKKLWWVGAAALTAAAVLAVVIYPRIPAVRYSKAEALAESGAYAQAAALFDSLGSHSDSRQQALKSRYLLGKELLEQGSYEEAADIFSQLDGYSDSAAQSNRCAYLLGKELLEQDRYEEAAKIFSALGSFEDSAQLLRQCHNELDYTQALKLLEQKDYAGAASLFEALGSFQDSEENLTLCKYALAQEHRAAGRYYDAAVLFYSLGEYADARKQCFACWDEIAVRETLVPTSYSAAAVHPDGTVTVLGLFVEDIAPQAAGWQDIIALCGGYPLVGLKADGTVVYANNWENENHAVMSQWRDIVAISEAPNGFVGLKADGTLVTTGDLQYNYWDSSMQESTYVELDVSGWTDIIAVSSYGGNIVGLKADGTVVVEGLNDQGQCNVSDWRDIKAICAANHATFGVKADGTVVVAGQTEFDKWDQNLYVSGWRDIVSLSYSGYHLVGLKSDGTVVATGNNYANQCSVDSWENIVAVVAGTGYQPDMGFTLGLKADGTVVLVGDTRDGHYRFTTLQNVAVPK